MPSPHPLRQTQNITYPTSSDGPARQPSNASTASSVYSVYSNPFAPSRTSTVSSTTSNRSYYTGLGHKRGISEATGGSPAWTHEIPKSNETSSVGGYKTMRTSLRPLPQPPSASTPPPRYNVSLQDPELSSGSGEAEMSGGGTLGTGYASGKGETEPQSLVRDRSGSIGPITPTGRRSRACGEAHQPSQTVARVTAPKFEHLQRSSTKHLRTLSRLTENGSGPDFSTADQVLGLHTRVRLQRTGSTRAGRSSTAKGNVTPCEWTDRNWMDKQRQFLQAYEYLCHIGEVKDWIERVIKKSIPPVVQLEEALRDGVTLAEIVQEFHPETAVKIFRHPKLQFRHSDNIALFFRFLAEVEFPEVFQFELIDLYEKKNIPKVIHTLHTLSWVLYDRGMVTFKICNLVGQLEFEHHELEETQRGLDRAGVSMPSFSSIGPSFRAEPEREPTPEPIESEDARVERELRESEPLTLELQAQARGALLRIRLGNMMHQLWDAEELLVDLQSRIRGDWIRQVSEYRLNMKKFAVSLQSLSRGFTVRLKNSASQRIWKAQEREIVRLQSLVRAWKTRENIQVLHVRGRKEEHGLKLVQAAIRGAMHRKRDRYQAQQTHEVEGTVRGFQSMCRGYLTRRKLSALKLQLAQQRSLTIAVQSMVKGTLSRRHFDGLHRALRTHLDSVYSLQSTIRGYQARKSFDAILERLKRAEPSLCIAQAAIRGRRLRREIETIRESLSQATPAVTSLQAFVRGMLQRKRFNMTLNNLRLEIPSIMAIQGRARGCIYRKHHSLLLSAMRSHGPDMTHLQSLARAMLLRSDIGNLLTSLDIFEEVVVEAQSAIRGTLLRSRFREKQQFFKENMEKVIKVQSFIRGRLQGEAYKSLTTGKNPPVGTIKGFVHLLNDSDFDFDEEIEFEQLRKTVGQHVRQNELAEQYIDQLDIKIALLVKNKITLDEVVKHQRHFGGHVGSLLTNTEISSHDPFDLKALNKNSRRKLEHYQELFFILQTQPQYLARLFKRIREQGTAEKECRRIEHLIMGLFGYAQKRREEYYLLKLMARAVKEEIDGCDSIQDYQRSNFFWTKLMNGYIRSPRDRKYMRDLLGPIVREQIIDNAGLDLESDPMQIYLSAINNEELRTGQRSHRRPDISREEAIKDPETRRTFTDHLQDLRDIADQFVGVLEESLPKLPYGVRFIAQQMFQHLVGKFPHEGPQDLLQIVGSWVWKGYLQPAMLQPETWGVIDRGLTPIQKRNLGEVAKVISQIALGRLFGGENVFLQPLNSYVADSIESVGQFWENLISVRDAEAQFDIDEFNDLYARTKPTLYIKMADIFAIHQLIASEISQLCPTREDILRELVHELGSAKTNENEMMGVSSAEISLTLNPKLHDVEDPDAEVKALFMETKRCILYIIRVQSGPNLMDILVRPITADDEERWQTILEEDFANGGKERGAYSEANTLVDISSMSYSELKQTALENIMQLERSGRVSRHNHYQDLLNAIAVDIRTKHRRRIQRQRELEGVRLTLGNLNEKALWLEQQLKSYNDYIEQAMVTLQNKKGKKRFLVPFTKQYNHERELQRSGRAPKFGSFKYSGRALADKGVLVSYQGYSEKQYDRINLTISSDEVGIFFIEGSMGSIQIPGASAQVPLDDLLQAQFNNHQFMNLFEGQMKLNVNLFLHLVFKKFYRDD